MPGFLQVFGFRDQTSIMGYGIDPTVQQLISSLMMLGTVVGAIFTGLLSRWISHRWLLFTGYALNNLAVILLMVATDNGLLYAGRLVQGIGNGFMQVVPQLYIQECAPVAQRGSLVAAFMLLTGVGQLIGAIVDNFTGKLLSKASYQIPLGVFLIVPTIAGVVLPFIPESPRWLVAHGQPEQARRSIVRLRSKRTPAAIIEAELSEIQEGLAHESQILGNVSVLDLFRKPNRRQTLLSVATMTSLGGAGSLLFQMFGTYFFQIAGQTKAFEETVGLTAAGCVGTFISVWLFTKVGRRPLLLFAFGAQAIAMLVVAGTSVKTPFTTEAGKAMVAFCFVFMFIFNLACAPVLYLVTAEIPSQHLRGYTVGLALAVSFVTVWLCTFTAPYFINPLELNWVCVTPA